MLTTEAFYTILYLYLMTWAYELPVSITHISFAHINIAPKPNSILHWQGNSKSLLLLQ